MINSRRVVIVLDASTQSSKAFVLGVKNLSEGFSCLGLQADLFEFGSIELFLKRRRFGFSIARLVVYTRFVVKLLLNPDAIFLIRSYRVTVISAALSYIFFVKRKLIFEIHDVPTNRFFLKVFRLLFCRDPYVNKQTQTQKSHQKNVTKI